MKKISNVEVRFHNLRANNIVTTSLSVGDGSPVTNPSAVQVPAREGVFSTPAAESGNNIWQ